MDTALFYFWSDLVTPHPKITMLRKLFSAGDNLIISTCPPRNAAPLQGIINDPLPLIVGFPVRPSKASQLIRRIQKHTKHSQ